MAHSDELERAFDRIAAGVHTDHDLRLLRAATRRRDARSALQIGRYNIDLHRGENVHIGDRTYYGADADAIRAALEDLEGFDTGIARGSLRSFGGFVIAVGMVISLIGAAMFFSGITADLGSPALPTDGPPSEVTGGFGLAAFGAVISAVGQIIRGFERSGPR